MEVDVIWSLWDWRQAADGVTKALHFIETLASGPARDMVPVLRRPAFLGWRWRWIRMLSTSCTRAFASSLLSSRDDVSEGTDGATPDLADLFGQVR